MSEAIPNAATVPAPPLVQGTVLDPGSAARGELRPSKRRESPQALSARLAADGYVFVPGFFPADDVAAARTVMARRAHEAGVLDSSRRIDDLIAGPGVQSTWIDNLTDGNPPLTAMLYGSATMAFFSRLLGAPARHFDFTWSRAVSRGKGTAPHCDVVFMGRGTPGVVTMWTAISLIPEAVGGLCILERSHRENDALRAYRSFDVDTYCENLGEAPRESHGNGGSISCDDANHLRRIVGGRWLWADYSPGDVLIFGLGTVHASLDNQSDHLRLSTDTRYQRADEPIDERWVGAAPIAHSLASQKPRIC